MDRRILVSLWDWMAPVDHLRDLDAKMSVNGNWNSSLLTMFLLILVHLGACWGTAPNEVLTPEDLKINYILTGGFSSYL